MQIFYELINFEFFGNRIEKQKLCSLIHIEGYSLKIEKEERYKDIIKELNKQKNCAITSRIIVEGELKDIEKIDAIVENICYLLSFATSNYVIAINKNYYKDEKIEQISGRFVEKIFNPGKNLIPIHQPGTLESFVEHSYPEYIKLKNELDLNLIFEYYLIIKSYNYLEIRCILGFILLETLSNNTQKYYQKNNTPIISNLMQKNIKKLKKILKDLNITECEKEQLENSIIENFIYKYPSLRESIEKLMKEYNMKYKKDENKIWELRKYYIHQGVSREKNNHDYLIICFIDRLLLHILKYKGEFVNDFTGYPEYLK